MIKENEINYYRTKVIDKYVKPILTIIEQEEIKYKKYIESKNNE